MNSLFNLFSYTGFKITVGRLKCFIIAICAPTKLKGFMIKLLPIFNLFVKYWKVNDLEAFQKVSNGIWVGYEVIPLNAPKKFKKLMT